MATFGREGGRCLHVATTLFDERSVRTKPTVNLPQAFSFPFWKAHVLLSIFGQNKESFLFLF